MPTSCLAAWQLGCRPHGSLRTCDGCTQARTGPIRCHSASGMSCHYVLSSESMQLETFVDVRTGCNWPAAESLWLQVTTALNERHATMQGPMPPAPMRHICCCSRWWRMQAQCQGCSMQVATAVAGAWGSYILSHYPHFHRDTCPGRMTDATMMLSTS